MNHKRPNPEHHNTGRAQPEKTRMAGRLNWFRLQVLGAQSNLQQAGYLVTRDPSFRKLKPEYQDRIRDCVARANNIAVQLKDIAAELSDLNSCEKWSSENDKQD